jgi:hypothetical protein
MLLILKIQLREAALLILNITNLSELVISK